MKDQEVLSLEKWVFRGRQNGSQTLEGVTVREKALTRVRWHHQWVKSTMGAASG